MEKPIPSLNEMPASTEGTKTLLGDPRKAIIKLALPMIVAFSVQTLYNIVDALWVSGLGPDALSAIGFFFPFFFMFSAVAAGIGIGGSAAISRKIGAHDKTGADNIATHTLIITAATALILTLPFTFLATPIFRLMGAGKITPVATAYGQILFAASILFFFTFSASAILRGEGDVKRPMYAMLLGAILNIILDPIFIYPLHLGVAGAAWATALSIFVSCLFFFFWLFIEKKSYVTIRFRRFKPNLVIVKDILGVGIPASFQQLSMALSVLLINLVIVKVAGTDGIAVYTSGWRITQFAILPLIGMATAVTAVCGAAYGGKAIDKLNAGYTYSIEIGIVIETAIALVTFFLAYPIARLFTTARDAARILPDLVTFLRTMSIFYPATAIGILSSSMFQGTGKGVVSLVITLIRTIVLTVPIAYFFAISLNHGLVGVWWGFIIANIAGGVISFIWARLHIKALRSQIIPVCP